MIIKNKQFGEIEYEENSVINFPQGLLGFEELKKFLLIQEEDGLFVWLTSLDEPEIIFPIFSINLLEENYETPTEYEPYGIVKLDKDPEKVTINLKAPVFIHKKDKKGFQKIIDNENYQINYQLFVNNKKEK